MKFNAFHGFLKNAMKSASYSQQNHTVTHVHYMLLHPAQC